MKPASKETVLTDFNHKDKFNAHLPGYINGKRGCVLGKCIFKSLLHNVERNCVFCNMDISVLFHEKIYIPD